MSVSARFGMPLLAAGQAQKEITHNEAIQLIEALVGACVEDGPLQNPPSNPAIGRCYIVGPSASGAWSGRAGCLACYTGGGWRFVEPTAGMSAMMRASGIVATYRGAAWDFGTAVCSKVAVAGQQVVGARAAGIAQPSGGATVDAECRAAVSQVIAALRQHGLIAP